MFYFIKTPFWLKKIYPSFIWNIPTKEKTLFLTFDDGPNEKVTPFVLDELKKYSAEATFFCIGKNVQKNPAIYKRIIDEGHKIGNHTYDHLNGWKTNDNDYIDNINEAAKIIDSHLFRPPYGKISKFQAKILMKKFSSYENSLRSISFPYTIIMWSLLSGDFDIALSPKKCLENILLKAESGDIIVFHDSEKAWDRLEFSLPGVLRFFSEKNFFFKKLDKQYLKEWPR